MKSRKEIAVIFSQLDYTQIPFRRLQQLDELGLSTIYILLNATEFHEAMHRKINLYGDDEARSVFDAYLSASKGLVFEIINTGNTRTEEEKLQYYLNTVQAQYWINIYLCKEASPLISEDLRAKPFREESTSCSFFPFFSISERIIPPPSLKPFTTGDGLKLLQRDQNPCLCYQMACFDLIHYQWLYNIFVELIMLNLSPGAEPFLNNVFKEYKDTIIKLLDAEQAFNLSHQVIYGTNQQPGFWALQNHKNNTQSIEGLKAKIPALIQQLIEHFEEHNASKRYIY